MLHSMTGYGKAEGSLSNGQKLIIEIRSVNGKNFELHHRLPSTFRPFESEIRKTLKESLSRGTIDLIFRLGTPEGDDQAVVLNKDLAKAYYTAVKNLESDLNLGVEDTPLIQSLLNLPDIITQSVEELDESVWQSIEPILKEAAEHLKIFRSTEGATIEKDLLLRIQNIKDYLAQIPDFEKLRIERIKERIHDALEKAVGAGNVDENRFEQELIFYIEKLDISEEKQRLAAHCAYFEEVATGKEADQGLGKKLNFVLQEIGREINTLGSKANDADMQRTVINMKDELEKAKEQILNVL